MIDSTIYSVKEGESIIISVKWPDSSVESYMGFSDSSVITAEWKNTDAVISGLKPGVSELYFGSDQECSIDRLSVVVVCYD